ncbi:SIR2 family protein [Mesorhizobium sp. M0227]|uniref:SIR2 family protein n=1 Tax=unclassified Mesorhizobium TaxID=325217 RepID=UPI00333AAF8C
MPTAATISVKETLDLLDGTFIGLSQGVVEGGYALWLGSGISRDRVVGLDGVLAKLIEFLRGNATADVDCAYRKALEKVLGMAAPSAEEKAAIDFSQPAINWPCLPSVLSRLWKQYADVLSVEVGTEKFDYLLWVGLDFVNTFASQDADAEHLAIGMLALEGVVTELATANWDGLLEAAMRKLGYPETFFRITVTGEDLRGPAAAAVLYKFHGCALRAIAQEDDYRPLLVARAAQITGWMSNGTFKIVRDQLQALAQRSRTLMIGMSAQDKNIQHLFGQVGAQQGWKWTDQPTPIVFSAQELGTDQKDVLNIAYGNDVYEQNRAAICEAACVQAYGKPLLLGLLLTVLAAKLQTLASDVHAPALDAAAHDAVASGIKRLRDRVAEAGNADRLSLANGIAAGLARGRHQMQNGTSPDGTPMYFPIDNEPPHQMKGMPRTVATGQREAAAALGLIGLGDQAAEWTAAVDDPTDPRSGALRLTSPNGTARVFFAANDENITNLMDCGAFDEDDADVVLICSRKVSNRQQRSPKANLRDGKIGPRYLAFGSMLMDAGSLAELQANFRSEVAI